MSLTIYDATVGNKLSWFAFALNVTLSFSQLPLMFAMIKETDAVSLARYSISPSLLQAVTCACWVGYGTFSFPSVPLVANNAIGLSLSFIYVLVFVIKRPELRDKMMAALCWIACVGVALIIYGVLYSRDASVYPTRDVTAGALTTVITIFFWASPLTALRAAAADLNDKVVPVPLTLSMISTTVAWLIVGILVGDMALLVCSTFGVALSLTQLVVILWIKAQRKKKESHNETVAAAFKVASVVDV
jgi:hypothetical protein